MGLKLVTQRKEQWAHLWIGLLALLEWMKTKKTISEFGHAVECVT